jgi:hypothetical protein
MTTLGLVACAAAYGAVAGSMLPRAVYRRWPDVTALVADLLTRELRRILLDEEMAAEHDLAEESVRVRLVLHVAGVARAMLHHPLFTRIVDTEPELMTTYTFQRLGTSHKAALEILGNPVVEPGSVESVVARDGDTTIAHLRIAGVAVTLTFVTPDVEHRVPFHATAAGVDGVVARELVLGPDYNAPALTRFTEAITSGRSPVGRDQLLSPVAVLSAIVDALETQ